MNPSVIPRPAQFLGLAGLIPFAGLAAGTGNYLRSDILFEARLRPDVRIAALTVPQREALADAALKLTRRSYQTRGVTCDPALAKQLKTQGLRFGQYRHWVFDRAGAPCHHCGNAIIRIDTGGRGLYLCEHCQSHSS